MFIPLTRHASEVSTATMVYSSSKEVTKEEGSARRTMEVGSSEGKRHWYTRAMEEDYVQELVSVSPQRATHNDHHVKVPAVDRLNKGNYLHRLNTRAAHKRLRPLRRIG